MLGGLLLPGYLALRTQSSGVEVIPGTVLVATDEYRLLAWALSAKIR